MHPFYVPDGSPPPWIDAPWWEVYGAQLRAEQMTREAWIEKLAKAWCLIRIPASLTPGQLAEQIDMQDRLLGRKFHPTYPY
jgi:hypothetical protein